MAESSVPEPVSPVSTTLTDAIIALSRDLDLSAVLAQILAAATNMTGARFAAVNVLDDHGVSVDFHYRGMDPGVWERIGRAPNAVGVLAEIPPDGALVIDEPAEHLDSDGIDALRSMVLAMRARGHSVVIVTHDLGILDVVDSVVSLDG